MRAHNAVILIMCGLSFAAGAQQATDAGSANGEIPTNDRAINAAPMLTRTIDGNKKAPAAQFGLLTDIVKTDQGAIAVGDKGAILVSKDLVSWTQSPSPTRSLLTAAYAVGPDAWAVGHDGIILHSTNFGATWERQRVDITAAGPLLDVLFLDNKRGFAVGAYGQFISTTDGGANWQAQVISERVAAPVGGKKAEEAIAVDESSGLVSTDMGEDEGDPHLNAIIKVGANLLMFAESGRGYRSVDQGQNWTPFKLPYEGSMFGAIAADDTTALAFGLRGNVFESRDAGLTWLKLDTGTQSTIFGAATVPGKGLVLVGASGAVLLKPAGSDDFVSYTNGDAGTMSGVLHQSDSEFVTVGENGISVYQPKN
jgi:photosystem II stability/assembly factor-like uncharacterized protein